MNWAQHYDPLGNALLSTLVAALPVVVLLTSIAFLRIRIHLAALMGLAVALGIAVFVYRMPVITAGATTLYGAAFGVFPIGWIILNIIFLYQLTVERGHFATLRDSLAKIAPDPRVQVILIAFSFGAFIEGMAGFGTPVAITGAILIQLGFKPLHASGLALIANTAPVAFGSLGIPITTMAQVTGLDAKEISMMVGRQLPFFSLIVPFWVVFAFAGWRGMRGVWPAALTAGAAFAIPQFLISNFHGPWLVDILSGGCSIGALVLLSCFWRPKADWAPPAESHAKGAESPAPAPDRSASPPGESGPLVPPRKQLLQAWLPWGILTAFILCWGLRDVKGALDHLGAPKVAVPYLHHVVQRMPPVAPPDAAPEAAEFKLNVFSATGTGILLAALVAGAV
ncbi:MAG: L-lactate permease, partial [Verrucomicrobiae bacterium]|nr:L-lactate permease [Verrucomicrobiae bacterium]